MRRRHPPADDEIGTHDTKVLNSLLKWVKWLGGLLALLYSLGQFETWNTNRIIAEKLSQFEKERQMVGRQEFTRRYDKLEAKLEKLDDRLDDLEKRR